MPGGGAGRGGSVGGEGGAGDDLARASCLAKTRHRQGNNIYYYTLGVCNDSEQEIQYPQWSNGSLNTQSQLHPLYNL
jgi:hypothetical protein